jgi:anti-sigma B factor antagonist
MDQPPGLPGLQVQHAGPALVVRLPPGDLRDVEDAQRLGQELLLVPERAGCTDLVVSLAGVEGLGSDLLGRLVMLRKKVGATGGRVVLCAAAGRLRRALEDAGLTRLFPLYATEEEAAASF